LILRDITVMQQMRSVDGGPARAGRKPARRDAQDFARAFAGLGAQAITHPQPNAPFLA